jgi:hypothetical protein
MCSEMRHLPLRSASRLPEKQANRAMSASVLLPTQRAARAVSLTWSKVPITKLGAGEF